MPEAKLTHATVPYTDSGSGPTLVFLHGALVSGNLWRKVVARLEAEFRCVVPDLPLGAHTHPAGPGLDFTLPGLAALVDEFLASLDLTDVTLVGNDTGGAITQFAALNHPERIGRVVLTPCDSHDNFLPKVFKPLQLAGHLPVGLVTALVQPLRLRALRRTPLAFGWLTKRPIEPREVEDGWIAALFADVAVRRDALRLLKGVDTTYTLDAAERLKSLDKPVLLAWAEEDKVFPIRYGERFAREIPGATLVRIPDSYAFVSEDAPDAVADAIRDFAAA
jgi:pimeloyl-ACP methyl ester carboxylesterase